VKTIKKLVSNLLARPVSALTNRLLTLLRNHQNLRLRREEIRAMRISFAQFGEDVILLSYFEGFDHCSGVYVDVGAFSPYLLSNTLLLHKLGWRGINVDFDEEKIKAFHQYRPDDHNVCAAVHESSRKMKILKYSNAAVDRCVELDQTTPVSACGECPFELPVIQTTTLTQIIEASPYAGCQIHYLNVDVEGSDLAVLKGLDFKKYRPRVITVEAWDEEARAGLVAFLEREGYKLSSVAHMTLFFVRQD
jgi:hypothetical protein